MFILDFFICDTLGFLQVMNLIKILLNIIRFVIPIIIIVLLIKDLVRNIIDPNNKDGIKTIINRITAAIIVFLVPTLIDLLINFINVATDNEYDTNYKVSSCYTNANSDCIKNIQKYLDCEGVSDSEISNCKTYRYCNNYSLGSNCSVSTVEKDDCKGLNENSGYSKFKR